MSFTFTPPSSKYSRPWKPCLPLYFSATVSLILSTGTFTRIEPRTATVNEAPHVNSMNFSAPPLGYRSNAALCSFSFSHTTRPPSGTVSNSPSFKPTVVQIKGVTLHPLNVTRTFATSFVPTYSPVLVSVSQPTWYLPTSSSTALPPVLVWNFFTTPGCHSYLPVLVSLFVVQPEFVNSPL